MASVTPSDLHPADRRPTELDPVTLESLQRFRRRRGLLLALRGLGVGLLVFVTLTLLLALLDYAFFLSDTVLWSLSGLMYVTTLVAVWYSGIAPAGRTDTLSIAQRAESAAPQLREELVSAVELADPQGANGSAYFRLLLQSRVAKQLNTIDLSKMLPLGLVRRWVVSGVLVTLVCVSLLFIPQAQFGRRLARAALPLLKIERASQTKIAVLEPSPASTYVAQGDAIAVVVGVGGGRYHDVVLQWQSEDGNSGETFMTRRVDATDFQPNATANNDNQPSALAPDLEVDAERFAANLSISSSPLSYRIKAGDAITLWHKLTPLPRPRVVSFEKLLQPPAYSQLPERVETAEHGDLRALQGTSALVTVTFDQPVEDATILFGLRGTRSQLEPVDESGTKFLAKISIKTSGQYQIDATSIKSGLNNPFSPSNTITPIIDNAPLVRWADFVEPQQLVSAIDRIELGAVATDDLPLNSVVQQYKIGGRDFVDVRREIEPPAKRSEMRWQWDLLDPSGTGQPAERLSPGDVIQLRLKVRDRKGAEAFSETIKLLIAEDAFNAHRHDHIDPLAQRTEQILQWSDQCKVLSERLYEATKSPDLKTVAADIDQLATEWKPLQAQAVNLIKQVSVGLSQTANAPDASLLEWIGRGVLDIETRIDSNLKLAQFAANEQRPEWAGQAKLRKRCLAV